MSYQFGWLGILQECFIPISILFIFGIKFIWNKGDTHNKNTKTEEAVLKFFMFFFILILLLLSILVAPSSNTGWNLQSNILHIYAFDGSSDINLSETKIAFIKNSQAWLPINEAGIHHASITVGKFKLHNEKTASVLLHHTSSPVLVLVSNNNYFVLSHPGVENLYTELKQRGVETFIP